MESIQLHNTCEINDLTVRGCSSCREVKPLGEFYCDTDGVVRRKQCKACICGRHQAARRERGLRNRVRTPEQQEARRQQGLARLKAWSEANPDRCKEVRKASAKKWTDENRSRVYAKNSARRAYMRQATFPGFDRWIEAIYETAQDLGLQVDHVMPLKGKNFCGLHVPWNMQLLSKSRNSAKRNAAPWQRT